MRLQFLRLVTRNWPFANGSGRLIDKFARRLTLGSSKATVRASDGFEIDVFLNDHIGRHIAISGAFDRSPILALLDHCRPGDRVLDIGANVGYVACLLLHRVPDSHVFCVEPQPGISSLLRTNLERFPLERWTLLEAALSDIQGQAFLELNVANRGGSKVVFEASERTVAVPLMPAAAILDSFDRLDIIKIDVEGHEAPIFRSMEPGLKRLQPRAILLRSKGTRSPLPARLVRSSVGADIRFMVSTSA